MKNIIAIVITLLLLIVVTSLFNKGFVLGAGSLLFGFLLLLFYFLKGKNNND